MGVERQIAILGQDTRLRRRARLSARHDPEFFEQRAQGDSETVEDRGITDRLALDSGLGEGACGARGSARIGDIGQFTDMLVLMCLASADDAQRRPISGSVRDHKGRRTIGEGAAIEQFQWRAIGREASTSASVTSVPRCAPGVRATWVGISTAREARSASTTPNSCM